MTTFFELIGQCRVSKGDRDAIKNSLNSQKSEIIKLALSLGYTEDKIKWFIEEEARSAYSSRSDWSTFESAIEYACTNKNIKYFLSFSQERFCRDGERSKGYKKRLYKANVALRFVSGDIVTKDRISRHVMDCTSEMLAEAYSIKVSEDTLRGCKQNAITRDPETGYVYKNGGSPPFWLKSEKLLIGAGKHGKDLYRTIWIENDTPYTATIKGKPVTKTMWEWAKFYFLELRLRQGLSIDRARDIFNEYHIPAPRSDHWESTCLYEAERNKALIGISIYNKREFGKDGGGRIKDQDEWIVVENGYPALLTETQFEQLKDLRQFMSRGKGRIAGATYKNDKLLANAPQKFTCASCGDRIVSSGNYYTCGKYNNGGKKACGSNYFAVPFEWLEEKVIKDITSFFNDKVLKKAYNDFAECLIKSTSAKDGKGATLEKIISKKEQEIKILLDSLKAIALTGNQIALKTISNEIEKLGAEKELLQKELADCKKTKLVKVPTFNEFKKQVDIVKALSSPENITQRRQIIWTFVHSITLDPSEKSVNITYYKNPFEVLFNVSKMPETLTNKKLETSSEVSNNMVAEAGFEPTTFGL